VIWFVLMLLAPPIAALVVIVRAYRDSVRK
jgi:hypothetical protein